MALDTSNKAGSLVKIGAKNFIGGVAGAAVFFFAAKSKEYMGQPVTNKWALAGLALVGYIAGAATQHQIMKPKA